MSRSSGDYNYITNLNFLYCKSDNENKIESETATELKPICFVTRNETDIKISQYTAYFHNLCYSITSKIKVEEWIHNGDLDRPLTNFERGLEVALGLVGLAAPIVGMAGSAIRHLPHAVEQTFHVVEHAVHSAKELGEAAVTGTHLVTHMAHEKEAHHFPEAHHLPVDMVGKRLRYFIEQLGKKITYCFRHELSTLTLDEAKQLARRHFKEIYTFIVNLKRGEITSEYDLYEKILQKIDPEPLNEIVNQITHYIENRDARWFKHCTFFAPDPKLREKFLNDFLKKLPILEEADLAKPKELEKRIREISTQIIFRGIDWWHFWRGKSQCHTLEESSKMQLSLSNHYITHLKASRGDNRIGGYVSDEEEITPDAEGIQITPIFNNPFWTAWSHVSMQTMSENVVLILMRYLTRQIMDSEHNQEFNKKVMECIRDLATSPEITKLNQKFSQLQNELNGMKRELTDIKNQMSENTNEMKSMMIKILLAVENQNLPRSSDNNIPFQSYV